VAISSVCNWLKVVKKFSAYCQLYNKTAQRHGTGKSKGLCSFLALPLQNPDTSSRTPYAPSVCRDPSSSNFSSVQNTSASMLPDSCRKIHRTCNTLVSSILRSHSERCLSATTVSTSLSTTIGRSQRPFSIVNEAAGAGEERRDNRRRRGVV
jgi:hypothetical protein